MIRHIGLNNFSKIINYCFNFRFFALNLFAIVFHLCNKKTKIRKNFLGQVSKNFVKMHQKGCTKKDYMFHNFSKPPDM